jgi:hemolysin activation/secretion protein
MTHHNFWRAGRYMGPWLLLATAIVAPVAVAAAPAAPAAPAASVPVRLAVQAFQIEGNSLLPEAELQTALAPFKGERNLAELKQAATAVQSLYRQAGYGAVIAYLPEQQGAQGVVTIKVLEGRLARVVVLGNQQFSAENIRRSLPLLQEGQTPQVQRLDAQIQLANESPVKQLAVVLEPGTQQGEVDARVTVTERQAQRWSLNVDNTGNHQTGDYRVGLGYQNAALWDRDHQLSLNAQTSPGHVSQVKIFSASYRVPFYAQGLSLDLYGAYSNVDGGSTSTAAGALQFNGRGRVLGLRLNKLLPHVGEIDQRFTLGLDQRAYLNNCAIAGLPAGACGSAGESVTVQPVSLEYQIQRGGAWPSGANVALVHNLGLGGGNGSQPNFDAVRAGARRHYTVGRVGGFLNGALPQDWRLQTRLSAQFSPGALVPGEQFGLAGAMAVRGYEEREISGDQGVMASIELMGPDLGKLISESVQGLRLLAFADAGRVWNRRSTPCLGNRDVCTLASVGVGLRLAAGPLQLRLDVAKALKPGTRTQRHHFGAHVQAVYSFE